MPIPPPVTQDPLLIGYAVVGVAAASTVLAGVPWWVAFLPLAIPAAIVGALVAAVWICFPGG